MYGFIANTSPPRITDDGVQRPLRLDVSGTTAELSKTTATYLHGAWSTARVAGSLLSETRTSSGASAHARTEGRGPSIPWSSSGGVIRTPEELVRWQRRGDESKEEARKRTLRLSMQQLSRHNESVIDQMEERLASVTSRYSGFLSDGVPLFDLPSRELSEFVAEMQRVCEDIDELRSELYDRNGQPLEDVGLVYIEGECYGTTDRSYPVAHVAPIVASRAMLRRASKTQRWFDLNRRIGTEIERRLDAWQEDPREALERIERLEDYVESSIAEVKAFPERSRGKPGRADKRDSVRHLRSILAKVQRMRRTATDAITECRRKVLSRLTAFIEQCGLFYAEWNERLGERFPYRVDEFGVSFSIPEGDPFLSSSPSPFSSSPSLPSRAVFRGGFPSDPDVDTVSLREATRIAPVLITGKRVGMRDDEAVVVAKSLDSVLAYLRHKSPLHYMGLPQGIEDDVTVRRLDRLNFALFWFRKARTLEAAKGLYDRCLARGVRAEIVQGANDFERTIVDISASTLAFDTDDPARSARCEELSDLLDEVQARRQAEEESMIMEELDGQVSFERERFRELKRAHAEDVGAIAREAERLLRALKLLHRRYESRPWGRRAGCKGRALATIRHAIESIEGDIGRARSGENGGSRRMNGWGGVVGLPILDASAIGGL